MPDVGARHRRASGSPALIGCRARVSSDDQGLPPFQPARPKSKPSQAQMSDLLQHARTTRSSSNRALLAMTRPGLEPGHTTIFSRAALTLE
jgi:hypothetical protein